MHNTDSDCDFWVVVGGSLALTVNTYIPYKRAHTKSVKCATWRTEKRIGFPLDDQEYDTAMRDTGE